MKWRKLENIDIKKGEDHSTLHALVAPHTKFFFWPPLPLNILYYIKKGTSGVGRYLKNVIWKWILPFFNANSVPESQAIAIKSNHPPATRLFSKV